MKNFAKLLSLLLALCLVLCACGTAGEREFGSNNDADADVPTVTTTPPTTEAPPTAEELLEGEWVATVDCGPVFNAMMKEALGAEMAGYMDFTGTSFDLIITFDGVDSYTQALDEASLEAFSEDVVNIVSDGLRAYLTDALSNVLGDMTLDAYLASLGMDFDALMKESGMDTETLAASMISAFESVDTNGTYKVVDGQLKLDSYLHDYELDGDTLVIEQPENSTEEMALFLFPMELTRAN